MFYRKKIAKIKKVVGFFDRHHRTSKYIIVRIENVFGKIKFMMAKITDPSKLIRKIPI